MGRQVKNSIIKRDWSIWGGWRKRKTKEKGACDIYMLNGISQIKV